MGKFRYNIVRCNCLIMFKLNKNMKSKILLQLCTIACLSTLLFSCSSSRYARYEKRSPGYSLNKQLNDKKNPQNIFNGAGRVEDEKPKAGEVISEMPASVPVPAENPATAENNLKDQAPALENPAEVLSPVNNKPFLTLQNNDKGPKKSSWLMRKAARSFIKSAVKDADHHQGGKLGQVDLLELIFAFFIPPIGVLLHEDGITDHFWIDLILTILLWLPGMIYAMLIVFDEIG
jgi:uncharacterized membrane protein YqaE (UPF0057 family)